MSKRETTQTTKTPTYVIACKNPRGMEFYRTLRHRWCLPYVGMNDDQWMKFPSKASAEGYLSSQDFSAIDEETRVTVCVKEIWL